MMYECGNCGNKSDGLIIDRSLEENSRGKSDFGVTPMGEIYCLKCDSRNIIVGMSQEELSCVRRVKK